MKAWIAALTITASTLTAQASIKIQSLKWGAVDATSKAGAFCDGESSCQYKISQKFIGPVPKAATASFKIRWYCDDTTETGEYTFSSDAENQILDISCPVPAAALVSKTPAKPVAPAIPPFKGSNDPKAWTQWLIQKQPTSLHAMIFNTSRDKVEEKIGYDCSAAIRNYLKSGKNFRSEVMLKKYARPISKFTNSDTRAGTYYHYTNAPAVAATVRNNNLDPIFAYARSLLIEDNENRWFWYVATDPVSSKGYGNIRITATFDQRSLVFIPGEGEENNNTNSRVNKEIQDEIIQRDSQLRVCFNRADTPQIYTNSIITYLATEASGISLVAYYGVDNDVENFPSVGIQWFQVIGPWAVQKAVVD